MGKTRQNTMEFLDVYQNTGKFPNFTTIPQIKRIMYSKQVFLVNLKTSIYSDKYPMGSVAFWVFFKGKT